MKALIIGATGATGKELLQMILKDKTYKQVDIFVRREVNIEHEKLKVHIIDFDKSEEWKALVNGDILFSCLGTTLETAGSKEAQWKIDYGYQYELAKIAQDNNVNNYVLISSSNASSNSLLFYTKMKGKLEEAVKVLSFTKLIIFNPPILIREDSERKMEVIGIQVIKFFNKLGLFHSQKPMETKLLAKAVKVLYNGQHSIVGQNILKFT
ncbi:NAD(P)H-binding protein [uncultured Flavobacterium sp.]|uniref:NAD(P)H-binding protein n=1 Tax=uncultured Flavobacterium sp. TaxID=165435 RepID=UPI0030ECD945